MRREHKSGVKNKIFVGLFAALLMVVVIMCSACVISRFRTRLVF